MTNDLPTLYKRVLAVVGEVPTIGGHYNSDGEFKHLIYMGYDAHETVPLPDRDAEALLCAVVEDWLVLHSKLGDGGSLDVGRNRHCWHVTSRWIKTHKGFGQSKLEALLDCAEAVKEATE